MRFYFDIDEYEFEDEYGVSFQQSIHDGVIRAVSDQVFYNVTDTSGWYSEVQNQVKELVKLKQDEICEKIIERVAEKIARKKALVAITPKVSEIAAADEANVAYFEQMIDKAIARRFGK